MPNRILQERICTSETLASLTPEAEVFFYRLMVQCDDYGRFDGRPQVIRARCYPLQLDRVDDMSVTQWLQDLEDAGLIVMYQVDGRWYLRMVTWDRYQQTRAKSSKFPPPPSNDERPPSNASNGTHVLADDSSRLHMSPYPEARSDTREAISGRREARSAPAREVAASADAEPPPPERTVGQKSDESPLPKPPPTGDLRPVAKPNRVAEVVDAVRSLAPEIEISPTARDGKAIRESSAKPERIAAAYVAVFRGSWGDQWMRENLSLHLVVERLAGFEASQRAGPVRSRNGQTAITAGSDLDAQRRRYATTLNGGPAA